MKKLQSKILILLGLGIVISIFYYFELYRYLSLEYLKENQIEFQKYYLLNKLQVISIYSLVYVISVAFSFPGATVLTLAAGAIFGPWLGTLIVSFTSTIGATLAFWVSRYLLRNYVQDKFKDRLKTINKGIKDEGIFYLFTLRLIPLVPFFLINIAMGLTTMRVIAFFFVSQAGMFLGTIVYVNAGSQLAQIDSLKGILSPTLILSFTLIGIFPLIAKKIVDLVRRQVVYRGFKKPSKFDYNMVVIGAGSAGLVTSYISAAVKAKVALIEKKDMGGDCLNTGCVPSKALIQSAKIVHYGERAKDFGLKSIQVEYDFSDIMERVQEKIKQVEPHDSVERYTELGVECISGKAKILSPWEVEVAGKVLRTKNITVATGGRPTIPPIKGIESTNYYTSDTIWELRERPENLLVIGAGPIGLELGQAFSRLGCKVTVVQRSARIMVKEDIDVSEYVLKTLIQEGVNVLTECVPREFVVENGSKILIADHLGKELKCKFDALLVATGRRANVENIGISELKIPLRANGTIQTNDYLQTNFPNIYSCGDVTGPYQLTHTAAHQAWYCAVNGLFGKFKKFKVDYRVIPWCTYTEPEVASVGINELAAKQMEIPYVVTKYGIDDLDRAIVDSEDKGFVKVLTVPGSDKILGATIVGNKAGELILEFITAMKHNIGINKILGTIHIYPTMGEANKYVAGVWKKNSVSIKTLNFLEKFHKWSL